MRARPLEQPATNVAALRMANAKPSRPSLLRPFDPRAPTGYVRDAPVLYRPLVGQKALRKTAQALARKQQLELAQQQAWKAHVFEQNALMQTRCLQQGANNAARAQRQSAEIAFELERTLDALASGERSARVHVHLPCGLIGL